MKLIDDNGGVSRPKGWSFDPVLAVYRRLLAELGFRRLMKRAALCRYHGQDTMGSDPAALLLGRRMLPIRLEIMGGEIFSSVMAYSLEGGLSRAGIGASFRQSEFADAVEEARKGFRAIRREVLFRTAGGMGMVGAVTLGGGSGGASGADEMWLARELTDATGGLSAMPLSLLSAAVRGAQSSGEFEVEGVRVVPGGWVWVRLETKAGVVMTEAAMLMGVERLGAATRLVLRGTDGVVSTCWTRGPGWVRRVVPAEEGDVWRQMDGTGVRRDVG